MKRRNTARVSFREIEDYCSLYCILAAASHKSFYFRHKGKRYRISDHPPDISRSEEYDYLIQVERPSEDLIQIHQAVINGYPIDHQGRVRRSA